MTNDEAIVILMNSNEYHHAKGELPHSSLSVEAFNMAIEALKEPKQGAWINTGEAIGDDIEVKCSLCGEELYWLANFCPNCGAQMVKEGDEK